MKKLPMLIFAGLTTPMLGLEASELSYLYKDQRIMAMGGANVAAGGYSTSIFSNPAGIAKVSNEHGMVIELLGFQAGTSKNGQALFTDLNDAIDSDNEGDILTVFDDYSGQTVHVDVSNYSSMTNNHGQFAWSIGLLSAVDANLTPHGNSYNLLEVQARGYGGITGAASYTIKPNDLGDLSFGLGLKVISQQSYEGALTPDQLVDYDNILDNLQDKMENNGTAIGADLGAIYQFNSFLKPSLGVSVLNIGGLDYDDSYGSQPMTVNLGAAIEPDLGFIKKTVIALDYVDLLNANQTRTYTIGSGKNVTYTENDDTDIIKRIRFGVSALLYENSWSAFGLATGIYQGAYTAGFDFTASIFQIGFSTYEEQLGPQHGDYTDRRYQLRTGFAW
ncbi:hypothetical protein E2R68_02235 [Psychromonas sp. RZ22]|uniref:hypothetical protein n=1 Tax=Psychromonas algarum TaxID=2555643 RepID=UPI0010683A25|nr:hypothetical protein [Psychromonas sp. RZ22]TEW55931.1 hypothetical protein E2R68_02235 [Psychromonas sp. RZ22]